MKSLRELMGMIKIRGSVSFDVPLAPLASYRVGGPADVLVSPTCPEDIIAVLGLAREEGIPHFVLGGGANILISDRGIRGVVLHMTSYDELTIAGDRLTVGAGRAMSEVAERAAAADLGGLEFIFSMPGSVGGAIWMNARCYGSSISDVLEWTEIIDEDLTHNVVPRRPGDFDYKSSPFQGKDQVIVRARFALHPGSSASLFQVMKANRADREKKGHFFAPSAGSVFKNNHTFGEPSGKIIDRLGLRGYRIGGAQVSPYHANIIINAGGATAADIEALIRHIAGRVKEELGFELEREVISVGQW